jgi:predicted ABC-type ATPase
MKLLTEQEMSERLAEVATCRVALDPDPMANGISSLNEKLASIQLFKDRVAFLLTEAFQNSNSAEIIFETLKSEHDRQIETLLSTDSSVMACKSAELRNATAKQKITEQVLRLHHAEIDLLKCQGYLKVLQNIHNNLESCNSNISRQITVLQLGAQVGEIQRSSMGVQGTVTKI